MRRARIRARAGFTLVELMVVLLVIGIALAAVLPSVRAPVRREERAIARAVTSLAAAARSVAATRGVPVTLTLELATGAYLVAAHPSPAAPADTVRSGTLPVSAGTRLAGGRDGWATMTFHPLGTARVDPVSVHHGEESYDVVVSPWNGSATVRRR